MSETTKKYIETVGRRKTSIARVRMAEAARQSLSINEKELEAYFPTKELQKIVTDAMNTAKPSSKFKITIVVKGGGVSSQADAVRHGIARALTDFDRELRGKLKKAGFLKRDSRAKERRKFGLKKARKAPQWSKR